MQLILVSPILPGRTEACRRFVQEMCDGRGDAYAASRTALGIDEERIWIHETATAATVIILLEAASPDDVHGRQVELADEGGGEGRRMRTARTGFCRTGGSRWIMTNLGARYR
jgi:hypothetical protein